MTKFNYRFAWALGTLCELEVEVALPTSLGATWDSDSCISAGSFGLGNWSAYLPYGDEGRCRRNPVGAGFFTMALIGGGFYDVWADWSIRPALSISLLLVAFVVLIYASFIV
ncbi:MAG TPA: hypothetical protein VNC42_03060, partial [Bradyrhizobium sp.]|nr:hypothetical protein [Bradyrhizobium sp.]